jgi:hypothetical protein
MPVTADITVGKVTVLRYLLGRMLGRSRWGFASHEALGVA